MSGAQARLRRGARLDGVLLQHAVQRADHGAAARVLSQQHRRLVPERRAQPRLHPPQLPHPRVAVRGRLPEVHRPSQAGRAVRGWGIERIGNSRDLNHVTACLKDSADAWNNHAFLCRETQQYQRAYESYQHAIEKEPASPQLWNDAAVVLHYHQPTEANLLKAQKMYRKAIDLATKVLADRDASEATRQYAQEAQANARANLLEIESKKRPVQKPPAK